MYSKIKIFGYPIHPMLVGFPVAFYTGALASFIVYNSNNDVFWFKAGYVANIAGVIMAALAAIPGIIDSTYIPKNTKPKKIVQIHFYCNVFALLLFTLNVFLLKGKWNTSTPALGFTLIICCAGFILTVIAIFMGWTLVQKHHVGVDPFIDRTII